MTRAQVIEKLGKPSTIRNYQGSTYLMYPNKCGKTCGMQDIVILDHDVVVDAVFRSPNRHYTRHEQLARRDEAERAHAAQCIARGARGAEPAATPTAALKVAPSPPPVPADSTKTLTSHPPADSADDEHEPSARRQRTHADESPSGTRRRLRRRTRRRRTASRRRPLRPPTARRRP